MVGRGYILRAGSRRLKRELHVRLPGTEPHLPHENVTNADRVVSADFELMAGAGLLRGQFDFPPTGCVRLGPRGRFPQGDRDIFARIRPSPDRDLCFLLQDHVVAEDSR